MGGLRARQEAAEETPGGAPATCPHCAHATTPGDRFCASCGESVEISGTVEDPLVGKLLAGKYKVLELAGMGGMARVYRAEQVTLGRPVALKVVHPHFGANEELRQRFYREARASSALNHPNSVRIIDFGSTDAGVLYLVMEYLEGEDLGAMILRRGIPTQLRACEILVDVLSALEEAHACGVVHRDLKPDNIFIERLRSDRSLVKVLDFGIATLAEPGGSSSITQAGLLCGTPEYMSPDQVSGAKLDGRSDLYSIGIVLYELLTGNVPFSKTSPGATALCHLDQTPPSLEAMAPQDVPAALVAIVERALQKDPDARYQSAKEMRAALLAHVDATRGDSVPPRGEPAPGVAEPPPVDTFVGRHEELSQLLRLLTTAHRRSVCVNICGEVGVGKTRLLRELAGAAEGPQCKVALGGPHPSTAPVAYWPVRLWMRALCATDDDGLRAFAEAAEDPLLAAGMGEVLDTGGRPARDRWSRYPLVAHALASVIRAALGSSEQRLILILDDAAAVDGTTLQVVRELSKCTGDQSVLLCVASSAALGDRLPAGTETLRIRGLARPTMATNPSWESGVRKVGTSERAEVLPLYVEQLQQLGEAFDASGDPELVELIEERLQRCDGPQRLLIQHAAVLGESVPLSTLQSLRPQGVDDVAQAVDALPEAGWLRREADQVAFSHPLIREVVEQSLPATLRASLHTEALALVTDAGGPLEVRVRHAASGGDSGIACELLGEAASRAYRRGDAHLARSLYREGWELSTAAVNEDAHSSMHETVATMAGGLALSLVACGDALGAEWLLRDQIEHAPAQSVRRALLMLSLSQVLREIGREDDARALFHDALTAGRDAGAVECQAAVHEALAAMDEEAGEWNAALSHLLSAHGLTYDGADALQQSLISLRLGSVMRKVGDLSGAVAALSHAEAAARTSGALDVAARALRSLACAEAERSADERARQCCREGMECAALAGQQALHARFAEALEATKGLKRPGQKLQRILEASLSSA